jgi:hypothetical protein
MKVYFVWYRYYDDYEMLGIYKSLNVAKESYEHKRDPQCEWEYWENNNSWTVKSIYPGILEILTFELQ